MSVREKRIGSCSAIPRATSFVSSSRGAGRSRRQRDEGRRGAGDDARECTAGRREGPGVEGADTSQRNGGLTNSVQVRPRREACAACTAPVRSGRPGTTSSRLTDFLQNPKRAHSSVSARRDVVSVNSHHGGYGHPGGDRSSRRRHPGAPLGEGRGRPGGTALALATAPGGNRAGGGDRVGGRGRPRL